MKIGKAVSVAPLEQKSTNQAPKFEISHEVRTSLVSDKGILWAFIVSLFFIFSQIAVIGLYFRNLPPEIPIFYSKTWGENMLGQSIFIWILPAIAVSFVAFNFLVYFVFFRNNKFLARVLFVSNAVIGFTTFWGAMKIVTLLA
ncbi:MAG: hypothetical protein UU23_C0002G0010 [Candidatus Curtissbacteria bacterium GW2011_GWA1_40_9]|uniref:DUF1648 domain-containing protein n=1 Tax=Candidatus Curtissbacteria bacterium GW2011_GWA1_40_9 TaxID=1618408 RepID=A0A0G0TMI6_9BACT|nr:MAG: hypothetical protein UU23_C0002G0010 [Candidatus Curtissbacteria bacterium GW2011_GWA1_40_9]